MLTNVSKGTDQSIEDYLRNIKTVADSLGAIQSPIFDLQLIQFTTSGLPHDYHSFVTTYSILPDGHTFDDLWSKLIFYEQRLNFSVQSRTACASSSFYMAVAFILVFYGSIL